jgi:hypothetical protein
MVQDLRNSKSAIAEKRNPVVSGNHNSAMTVCPVDSVAAPKSMHELGEAG